MVSCRAGPIQEPLSLFLLQLILLIAVNTGMAGKGFIVRLLIQLLPFSLAPVRLFRILFSLMRLRQAGPTQEPQSLFRQQLILHIAVYTSMAGKGFMEPLLSQLPPLSLAPVRLLRIVFSMVRYLHLHRPQPLCLVQICRSPFDKGLLRAHLCNHMSDQSKVSSARPLASTTADVSATVKERKQNKR